MLCVSATTVPDMALCGPISDPEAKCESPFSSPLNDCGPDFLHFLTPLRIDKTSTPSNLLPFLTQRSQVPFKTAQPHFQTTTNFLSLFPEASKRVLPPIIGGLPSLLRVLHLVFLFLMLPDLFIPGGKAFLSPPQRKPIRTSGFYSCVFPTPADYYFALVSFLPV